MTARLFTPIMLGQLQLANRVVIAPMCQYEAADGLAGDWHLLHLGRMASSGAGLMVMEATGVLPDGRITDRCLGLYNDEQQEALRRILTIMARQTDMHFGIQLNHAGRKAGTYAGWEGRGYLPDGRGWPLVAPSALPFSHRAPTPIALSQEQIEDIIAAFAASASRAVHAGFRLIELHAAHGYLMSQFLSNLANRRTDNYGGSLENRMRFPLEVLRAVRAEVPQHIAVTLRINGTDWADGGITPEEAAIFARACQAEGADAIHVSSGGNALVPVPSGPGYQLPFAHLVKDAVSIPVIGVGMIRDGRAAEDALERGDADLVAIGRSVLNNPHWLWRAAEELGEAIAVPRAYARAATREGIPAAREQRIA